MQDESSVYARAPIMLYWEVTRACDLACTHCRAEAIPFRDPQELTTAEAKSLLRQIVEFGDPMPHLVCTGGDPLMRPDLMEIVREAVDHGLRVSIAPSGTSSLTREVLARLKQAGVQSLSLSLDGSTPPRHDGFRGVPGCFGWTAQAARWARELPLQINTLVTAETLSDLPDLFRLVSSLHIVRWSLFFLIPVGRGRALRGITPDEAEVLCHWLYERSAESPFTISTTEAPHFRRVALQRMRAAGMTEPAIRNSGVGRGFGVRDGNGVAFISHRGDVYPSGFLPVAAGNVRTANVVDLYRHAPVFTALRDVTRLKGKCGRCPFNAICGGSRARAFASTGDYLESDPLCAYQSNP